MTNPTTELKPCAHCRSSDIWSGVYSGAPTIACRNCEISIGGEESTLTAAEIALRWNRRSPAQPDSQEARDALAEICEEWAGAECGVPKYAQEAYAIELARRMYRIAAAAMSSATTGGGGG